MTPGHEAGSFVHPMQGLPNGGTRPPRGTRLNIKGYEDPWVTEQLIYLL